MIRLETSYLGLKLKNPVIVSSSGLTNSVEKIKQIEKAGAGAVVLKSLFEEQINHEAGRMIGQSNDYPEAEDYISAYTKSNSVGQYLELIEGAKKETNIPIIASINCVSADDWTGFAKQIQDAGADALELNIHIVPVDVNRDSQEIEQVYYTIVETVKERISIPIVVKIGYHFSNLNQVVNGLFFRKVKGVVLFNRFYQPDIDIEKLDFTSSEVFSSPADIRNSLRWVGIISDKVKNIEVSASTGIHDGAAAVKFLLAGAQTVQVCSVLYKKGIEHVSQIIEDITAWMESKKYNTIDEFRGKMNYSSKGNHAIYERAQFMKYFSNYE
ncbi:MAG: dihydroorotate dehydrogenase-like protein [Bacteroidales bacterium]|nr:dihydroorotate dehydrogenase-like protein [Bacteroidales bacterium]MCF8456568.1 dihydroorotate dehydrogenase-like protein [Bacteroidales bacterium]